MIKLPDSCRKVALLAKRLRHTQLFGNGLPEDLTICVNAGAVGIQAREQRISAGSTQRKRAIRFVEQHAARCQTIDIRRLHLRVTVTAEQVVEVIRDDEQHIPPSVLRNRR